MQQPQPIDNKKIRHEAIMGQIPHKLSSVDDVNPDVTTTDEDFEENRDLHIGIVKLLFQNFTTR